MSKHGGRDRGQLKSPLFEPPAEETETSERVQLKQAIGHLGFAEQVEAVRPRMPVQTLQVSPVQREASGAATASIHEAAQVGVSGSASSLPHLGRIQAAFGHHDMTGVRAHTDSTAAKANEAMGAKAYATGNAIAFKGTPDLHTAAHEAAHVVQQRAGVSLPGGVGQVGDAYEQQADAVANRVAYGKSAVDLLDQSPGGGGDGVQMLWKPLSKLVDMGKAAANFITNPKETIYELRLGMEGRQEEVLGAAHEIGNEDIVLEQLAHAGAYGRLDQSKLPAWGYSEAGRIDDAESGFHCVVYMPTSEALTGSTEQGKIIQAMYGRAPKPVIAMAGTNPKEGRDVSDDVNRAGVGAYQFASNAGKIEKAMSSAGGKLIVTGHSLGGAVAQHAACNYPGMVDRVVTFQSPGINAETSAKLKEWNANAAPEDHVDSTHHRAEGDIVHAAGETLTEGEVFEFESVGLGHPGDHMIFPLSRLAMARGGLIPGFDDGKAEDKLVRVKKSTHDKVKGDVNNKIAEWGRTHLGGIVRDKDMEPYVEVWKLVEEMAAKLEYTLKRIHAVIEINNKLTDVQKIKMRDAVTEMFGEVLPGSLTC